MSRFAAAAALMLAMLVPEVAHAYCRSSTGCDPTNHTEGKVCQPGEGDDCGMPLYWAQPCVGFNIQKSASSQVDYATADMVLQQAFISWLNVDCGGPADMPGPSIQLSDLGPADCARNEYNEHGGNTNSLIFQDDKWPHENVLDGNQDIALTTVTYDTRTGEIFDADIEVNSNPMRYVLTTTDTTQDTDLLSVLTHECGHFFGLGHAQQPMFADATMRPSYDQGTTDLRSLSSDDSAGICSIYPPGRDTVGKCDFLPRHGFSSKCVQDQTEGKCSYEPPNSGSGLTSVLMLIGATLVFRARSGSRRR